MMIYFSARYTWAPTCRFSHYMRVSRRYVRFGALSMRFSALYVRFEALHVRFRELHMRFRGCTSVLGSYTCASTFIIEYIHDAAREGIEIFLPNNFSRKCKIV